MKAQFEAAGEPYIILDLGDFIQGSSFATYLSQIKGDGTVIARAMNELGYDYQIIGNHDFNFGLDYLKTILAEYHGEVLSNNIINGETGEVAIGQPYVIHELNDLKIGIIGATTHFIPHWELQENYAGLSFRDAFEATQECVNRLRPQVDVLIVAYHGGFEKDLTTGMPTETQNGENQAYRMLTEIEGIDVLLTGHQHRLLNQNMNYTIAMQAGYAGEAIGHITLEISDKKLTAMTSDLIHTATFEADKVLQKTMQLELVEAKRWLETIIGHAPIRLPHKDILTARMYGTPFVEFINQIQLRETGADFSATTLINESFTKFKDNITEEILMETYPYYNLIATVRVSGRELFEIMSFNLQYVTLDHRNQLAVNPNYLEPKPKHYNWDIYSGLKVIVDMHAPKEKRLMALIDERTGKSIEWDKDYTLAISQFRAVGGGEYHWFTPDKLLALSNKDIVTLLREALVTYDSEEWRHINTNFSHIRWI